MVFTNGARVSARSSSGRGPRRATLNQNISNASPTLAAAASRRVAEARAEADREQLFEVEAQTHKWLARRHKFVCKTLPPEETQRLR